MSGRYRFDSFELRVPERELLFNESLVAVEPKVFDLLAYLVGHRDRAVGRDELIAAVWGRVDVADSTLAQAILRLRRVLESGSPDAIRTLPRHGYRWVTATETLPGASPAASVKDSRSVTGADIPALHPEQAVASGESPEMERAAVPLARPKPHFKMAGIVLAAAALIVFGVWQWPRWFDGRFEDRPRLAILPAGSTASTGSRLNDLGTLELLRRDLVAAPDAPAVLTIDAIASALADPAVRASEADGLAERIRQNTGVTDVLEVDVARSNAGVIARATLYRNDGPHALKPAQAARLDQALALLAQITLKEIGRASRPVVAAAVAGADGLAQALALQAQGRARDAHDALLALHAAKPDDAEILTDLAASDCALEQFDDCERHIAVALALPMLSDWQRANAHLLAARQRLESDDDATAATEIASAEQAAAGTSDQWLQARVLDLRYLLATHKGEETAAQDLARRALTLHRLVGDAIGEAELQLRLGRSSAGHGRLEDAITGYGKALSLFRARGDKSGETRALSSMSKAFGASGRYQEADDTAREALRSAEMQQDPAALRASLVSSAWAAIQVGRLSDARETVHRALADAPGNLSLQSSLYSLLGIIDAAGGRYRNAMASWDEAQRLGLQADPAEPMPAVHLAIVYAALNDGDIDRARQEVQRLREAAKKYPVEDFSEHADALLSTHDGQLRDAAERYSRVWRAARSRGTVNQQMLADYSDVLFRLNDLAGVESLLGEPMLPVQEGYLYQLVKARYLLRRGQSAAARIAFEQALKLAGERFNALVDVTRKELRDPPAAAPVAVR